MKNRDHCKRMNITSQYAFLLEVGFQLNLKVKSYAQKVAFRTYAFNLMKLEPVFTRIVKVTLLGTLLVDKNQEMK